jgi:elongation factor 1 alpha-like protein
MEISGLSLEEMPCQVAFAGDQVTVTVAGIDMQNVSLGYILCDPQNPIPSTSRIEARIVLFNLQVPVTQGFPVMQYKCQI